MPHRVADRLAHHGDRVRADVRRAPACRPDPRSAPTGRTPEPAAGLGRGVEQPAAQPAGVLAGAVCRSKIAVRISRTVVSRSSTACCDALLHLRIGAAAQRALQAAGRWRTAAGSRGRAGRGRCGRGRRTRRAGAAPGSSPPVAAPGGACSANEVSSGTSAGWNGCAVGVAQGDEHPDHRSGACSGTATIGPSTAVGRAVEQQPAVGSRSAAAVPRRPRSAAGRPRRAPLPSTSSSDRPPGAHGGEPAVAGGAEHDHRRRRRRLAPASAGR